MTALPDADRVIRAIDATWPSAAAFTRGPWLIRRGEGGGQRVSAATPLGEVAEQDIATAESEMRRLGQHPLFMLRPRDAALDGMLERRGYRVVDPVMMMVARISDMPATDTHPLDGITAVEPLALMRSFWDKNGIGPARLAVMARAGGPKTYMLTRHRDALGACAFVACDGDLAMMHALVVAPGHRRQGVARRMIGRAAIWAAENGARFMAVLVTGENLPARNLYAGQGMQVVGKYHYRKEKEAEE